MHLNLPLVQKGLIDPRAWVRALTLLGLCLAAGLPIGAVIGLLGGVYGTALLLALCAGYLMLRSTLFGLIVLIGVICLLPFAALPINIGFSPTFLDLVFLALFFVWISRIAAHKEPDFVASSPTLGVLVFVLLAVVSFVLGLSHAPLTANVIRHFGEILMSILIFLLTLNTVRTRQQLHWIVMALIVFGFVAALIGVILYFLPDTLSMRILSTLRVVRYPSGSDVLRYVEDDPTLPLRAVSTSIDPNVLGGMLIFVTTLTAAHTFAARPVLPRRALIPMLAIMGLCMILTFSRGSFGGLAVALVLLGVLRYRHLLWIGLLGLALMLVLPAFQDYVIHAIEGLQGQDLATQMRLGEYKDAFILIGRYPWFGVGFAGSPDIDTYIGVSNVYLLVAEEMGIIGLAALVVTLVVSLINFGVALARRCDPILEPTLLGTSLAVAGGMVGGMLDHYLFNLNFPHAAALLWLFIGLSTVTIRLCRAE